MGPYRPAPFRFPLGSRALGQTFDQMFGWSPVAGDAFRLFFHTSTAYLGVSVGLTAKNGFLKYFGWFLGLGQGIAALCDATSLVQRAVGMTPGIGPNVVPPAHGAPGSAENPMINSLPATPAPTSVLASRRILVTTAVPG